MSQTATLPARKPRATRVVAQPARRATIVDALAEIPRMRLTVELLVLVLGTLLLVSMATV